ncbi:energy-coupling factor transporter transmembrane protein EcfT [Paenibacillus pasadenensis]|uniref:energy-coupling factor transporter transmembrane component T n=1 Tax=Paenibacillus pasadenensis TaxID=217090 RepID=UPI00203C7980|nr:energy-coupling factor transporter transmembrane component T [Paenibacillus pasadenensis]MCM3750251.1 energy-coupling factor transporter transmembrane protein EcfT [Paenibacillus pasadenensis]
MVYGFASLHPRVCFLYFALLLSFCMLFLHPLLLGATLAAVIGLNLSLDGGRALRRSIGGYMILALFIFIVNPLFSSRGATILFYVWDRAVTLESVVYGALFSVSMLCLLIAFTALNLVLNPGKLLLLLSPIAPQTAFAVTVTMRFVPLLTRRLKAIMTVQRAMGYFTDGMGRRRYAREAMETLHALVSWSLEEALQTAASMRSRGYGIGRRSSADEQTMDGRDWLVCWVLLVVGGNSLIGRLMGVHAYEVYPRLEPLGESPLGWLHLASYLAFLALPLIMNEKERLHWRHIRSNM